MGHIVHHVIVVTSDFDCEIDKVIDRAKSLAMRVSEQVESHTNRYRSVFVAPDGSKSGWAQSDMGDAQREQLKAFLRERGRTTWVEVSYSEDDSYAAVTDSPW